MTNMKMQFVDFKGTNHFSYFCKNICHSCLDVADQKVLNIDLKIEIALCSAIFLFQIW